MSEQMEQAVGNTETTAKVPQKSRNWCFTYNNPQNDGITPEQMEHILSVLSPVAFVFQLETGEAGTPHYQGCVTVKNPIAMPKFLSKRIHWESTRSWAKSILYCQKAEGRIDGPWALNVEVKKPLQVITELRPWQAMLKERLDEEPDSRTILWLWEPNGNVGKTAMAKFICSHYSAVYVNGKGADIKYAVQKYLERGKTLHAAVFGFTRTNEDYIPYSALEEVKDGIFFSGKYEAGMVMYNSPHVVCFANFPPDRSKLSEDRWDVINVNEFDV